MKQCEQQEIYTTDSQFSNKVDPPPTQLRSFIFLTVLFSIRLPTNNVAQKFFNNRFLNYETFTEYNTYTVVLIGYLNDVPVTIIAKTSLLPKCEYIKSCTELQLGYERTDNSWQT